MGFSPTEVDAMTLWQFACCAEGFRKLHQGDDAPPTMSNDRLASLGIVGF